MPEIKKDAPSEVTLEQLIQLKRSERPSPQFWEEFERDFQQRRLAALVKTTPWYVHAVRSLTLVLRKAAPFGVAATALAVAFIVSDNPNASPTTTSAIAIGDQEARFTTLPEEHLSPASATVESVTAAPLGIQQVQSRYVVHELGIAAPTSRSFITLTSPATFSNTGSEADAFALQTLSAVPALRSAHHSTNSF